MTSLFTRNINCRLGLRTKGLIKYVQTVTSKSMGQCQCDGDIVTAALCP